MSFLGQTMFIAPALTILLGQCIEKYGVGLKDVFSNSDWNLELLVKFVIETLELNRLEFNNTFLATLSYVVERNWVLYLALFWIGFFVIPMIIIDSGIIYFILVRLKLEEKGLKRQFGKQWVEYVSKRNRLIPFLY